VRASRVIKKYDLYTYNIIMFLLVILIIKLGRGLYFCCIVYYTHHVRCARLRSILKNILIVITYIYMIILLYTSNRYLQYIVVFCSNCIPIHGFRQEMLKPTRNVNNIIYVYIVHIFVLSNSKLLLFKS